MSDCHKTLRSPGSWWSGQLGRFTAHPFWLSSINFAAATIVVCWLFLDGRFEASVDWWRFASEANSSDIQIRDMGDWWWLSLRNKAVLAIGFVAGISTILMLVGLWVGATKSRTLQAWFVAISVLAIWLAVLPNWQEIAWTGKKFRMQGTLFEFSSIVDDLHSSWPATDGERETIGPFMAYPEGDPGTLILLTLPELETASFSFSAIEGGVDRTVRFELVGRERGDWLEWHPTNDSPGDFISGIGEVYQVARHEQLSNHWHLVRYRSGSNRADVSVR
ncbi:hypothetical protein [Mariniblastus fucicola]|uniref:Uncharacterized protein n=1 Tax=Mariniblastus fucicola TaxID=980251 RepID=A0A5B9PBP1_9BACT|nr:hypothetical protein [Mariniblastus fucicola]QEG22450.1 hypothetical protein MFFC18_23300 [Mariniblastus fucicola]